ncbi:hypothetical protein [Pseudobacillus badius]|uniref:hypothetical protein n=1 Tax=Bacillus badius TaxID=1455 RepID=UPI0007B3C553|nr:hypothetical protein [Bacillus badius]KZR57919.1 hypothetical protein A3781_19270 [Bacillus badius]
MPIKFGDLYDEWLALEEAIEKMRLDIENADCDSATKCILETELEMLEQKFYELGLTEFDFEKLNFVSTMESIERCLHCIDFSGDFSDIAPPPFAVASTCGSKKTPITLNDIEAIRIYEMTTSPSKSVPDKYEFTKQAFPYEITTSAKERYVVTYDTLRNGISIKGFNRISDKAVTSFGNIAKVEVKLNEPAKRRYGVEWLMACKVLLTTRTPMNPSYPLSYAVDGKLNTCPRAAWTPKNEIEMVFQFYV